MKTQATDLTTPLLAIDTTEEWQELLSQILDDMDCRTGTLHRYDPESKLLKLVAHIGIPEELMDKVKAIPMGKGIAGAAAEKREAVHLCNLQTDTSGVSQPAAKKTHVAGSLAVPVLNGKELVGTLGVGMFEPHEFSKAETEELWNVSHWLAAALKNSV